MQTFSKHATLQSMIAYINQHIAPHSAVMNPSSVSFVPGFCVCACVVAPSQRTEGTLPPYTQRDCAREHERRRIWLSSLVPNVPLDKCQCLAALMLLLLLSSYAIHGTDQSTY
jgi:hypothetical protein